MGVKLSGKSLKKWVLVGLCLFSAALMTPPAGRIGGFCRQAVRCVLAPASMPGAYVTVHLRTRLDEMTASASSGDSEKVRALHRQIFLMQQMVEHQRRQIQTLTKWNETLEGFRCRLLPARVIAAESLAMRNRRLVGAGRRSGVNTGDLVTTRIVLHESELRLRDKFTVLGQNYVVGCIGNSSDGSAMLLLVTDPHFKMPARLWRLVEPGRKRTIYLTTPSGEMESRTFAHSGRGPGAEPVGNPIPVEALGNGREIVLEHVPVNHGVRAGDILTSGDVTGMLPLGLTIGRVSRMERDRNDAHFVTVFVEPLADLHRLRDVYIVLPY